MIVCGRISHRSKGRSLGTVMVDSNEPFYWVRRWFTIGAILWLLLTTSLLVLAFVRDNVKVSAFFAIYLLLTVTCSVVAFILYGIDKRRAIKDQPRISERTLHVLSLLGGWPGCLSGRSIVSTQDVESFLSPCLLGDRGSPFGDHCLWCLVGLASHRHTDVDRILNRSIGSF